MCQFPPPVFVDTTPQNCPCLRSSFTCFIVYTAACFSSVIHEMCLNFLSQILTKTGSPLSAVVRFKSCTAACLWAVSHWGENVSGWRVNCKHRRYSEVPPCSRLGCENAERRGGDTLSSAIWDLTPYSEIWDMLVCSLQIFLKWCAAEQHWDKVCNFGKYFELWKDKTILQYYLYHSHNCTMSSNNTSAVKSTSHHLSFNSAAVSASFLFLESLE